MSRRSVVQRWPAVPIAEKAIARVARSRSADGQTIAALLPPSSRIARPKRLATRSPTAWPIAVEPVAETTGMRRSSTRRSPTSRPPVTTDTSPSGAPPNRAACALEEGDDGERGERRLFRGLPDDRIAADESERGVPGPDGDGEIEGRDDRDRPDRVPLLHQTMVGPLADDGETVELTRQADGEVADVDHLLDLAEAFGENLAGLDGDEPAEVGLRGAELLAEEADQFAAPRRRHRAPQEKGRRGGSDCCLNFLGRGIGDRSDRFAGDRRTDGATACRCFQGYAERPQKGRGFLAQAGLQHAVVHRCRCSAVCVFPSHLRFPHPLPRGKRQSPPTAGTGGGEGV